MTHPFEDESRRLREALECLLHAVCGETGFANAVRTDTGKAYPWEALDIAEENAIAALAAEPASGGEATPPSSNNRDYDAPPPPPTQGEEERAWGLALVDLCRRTDKDGLPYFQADGLADMHAAASRARVAKLEEALTVLLEEAEGFNVSGVYFDEPCMGHKGPALARAALEDRP